MLLIRRYEQVLFAICYYLMLAEKGCKHVSVNYFIGSAAISIAMFQAVYVGLFFPIFNLSVPGGSAKTFGLIGAVVLIGLNTAAAFRSENLRAAVNSLVAGDTNPLMGNYIRTFKYFLAGIPIFAIVLLLVKF